MARMNSTAPAIVILGAGALETARRIQARYPGAQVHGLAGRVEADVAYGELGAHLRELYMRGTPLVVLCAAGIVIRCIAPLLSDKGAEPPVLAVAEDGSAVVPLLGGLAGVNRMAREIADALSVAPAITTSGELRFGTCVLNPPDGYALSSLTQGKRFVSDLLAGESTRIEGEAPWLDDAQLPRSSGARLAIRVTPQAWNGSADELLIHPRSVVAAIGGLDENIAEHVQHALSANGIASLALAVLLAPIGRAGEVTLTAVAATLGVALRFVATPATESKPHTLLAAAMRVPHEILAGDLPVALALAHAPVDPSSVGQARGRLSVIGLGPGDARLMVPAARDALDAATDVLGYETYVTMAGPFRADQRVHGTDNREEMQRARHAFELAAQGRSVVMVSSGDPGVFAMAAAVLEALHESGNARWASVELEILPGVSAAMATAAQAGAPLGHDFCMLSLSDNLKPWDVIENRLRHAAAADLVMAFYNPVSRARPWQLDRALDIVREFRSPETTVVLGRNVGRPGGQVRHISLGELRSEMVDMRTMVIIGSSLTRAFSVNGGEEWVYTPRWYRQV
ncbi:precorrin-3B C(17)-methyltransferase [Paraburkholderia sartisoli]|nr:precorrin-3B C(17)-methyltransferase [Paraburkholderia sartisoli]